MGALRFMLAIACLVTAGCKDQAPSSNETAAASSSSSAAAVPGDATLTLVPPGYERAAAGPSFFFHVIDDVYGAVDPIDHELLFMDGTGKSLSAVALPESFEVRDVDLGHTIRLVGDKESIEVPRSATLPKSLVLGATGAPSSQVKRNGDTLQIAYQGRSGPASLTLPLTGSQKVLTAKFIGLDDAGNAYVYWQAEAGGESRDQVVAYAGRFPAAGGTPEATPIALDDFAAIPALPIAVTPSGQLILMQPMSTSIKLVKLEVGGDRSEEEIGLAPSRVLDVGEAGEADDAQVQQPEEERAEPPQHNAAFGTAAVARARAYLNATWTLKPGNFSKAGIANACVPSAGKYWRRPHTLTQERVGQTITGLPYKWGGSDTIDRYQQKLAADPAMLAGDVCTCREANYGNCLVPQSAGVDCSGFVSRSWGLNGHVSTSALMGRAAVLASFAHLRAGDILNRPGNHVRLVVGLEPGPELRIRTIESAVSCGGVCEKVYTPAELNKYKPMRKI